MNSETISASIEIFSMLEHRLDVSFERIELITGFNDIALSQSIQAKLLALVIFQIMIIVGFRCIYI